MNGGPFKDGNVSIRVSNGSVLTAKLDWDQEKTYTFQNRQYWRIPFLFDGKIMLSDSDKSENYSYSIVLRKNDSGKFEGAILNTIYGAELKDSYGKIVKKNYESYHLLNGEESTIWISETDFSKKTIGNRVRSFNSNLIGNSQNQRSSDCQIYESTERVMGDCWSEGDNVICNFFEFTTYTQVCENDEEEDGDEWGGGGGSGGESEVEPETVISSDYTFEEPEFSTNYVEEDKDYSGQYVPITFEYRVTLTKIVSTGTITSVLMHNIIAQPMISYYTDKYGRIVTRVLTLFNHMNNFEILMPPTTVLCY